VAAKVLDRWASFSPSTRAKAMQLFLSRESWTIVLLERLVKGQDIPLDALQRERLMRHGSTRVHELASQMLATPSDRAQVIGQFRPALRLRGDAGRGRSVYERACALCHRKGNQGKEVGPDLNSVVQHSPEKLLANILDPSADIQPGYHAYQCELTNHAEMYGVITSETGNSLTMKLADGTEHVILRRDIRELRGGNLSLMPEGLERGLTQQDMADLIQWLRTVVD
jgi:putative heme-binding domain-containing protein